MAAIPAGEPTSLFAIDARPLPIHLMRPFVLLILLAPMAQAQTVDSLSVTERWFPDPSTAVRRAALVPGGGQIYNRQYWKLPIAYGALAGTAGFALWLNDRYLEHRHAYLYIAWRDDPQEPNKFGQYQGAYEALGELPEELLRGRRNVYRRNRDLTYFAIGAVYGLTLLDAYASAHLLRFDVSEDLSMRVHPNGAGVGLTVRW